MNKLSKVAIALCGLGVTGLASADAPKPPPEVGDMAKAMTGTWKCEGTVVGMDNKDTKAKMTMKSKADLDGFWVHDSMEGTMGEGKDAMKFKMEAFTTFNPTAKKWQRVAIMNDGGQMVGTSDGMKDMKMDTNLETSGSHGEGMAKDHVDASDLKKGMRLWGEMSTDKGKTWQKSYDMICKK
jgi:hypothetical protein